MIIPFIIIKLSAFFKKKFYFISLPLEVNAMPLSLKLKMEYWELQVINRSILRIKMLGYKRGWLFLWQCCDILPNMLDIYAKNWDCNLKESYTLQVANWWHIFWIQPSNIFCLLLIFLKLVTMIKTWENLNSVQNILPLKQSTTFDLC